MPPRAPSGVDLNANIRLGHMFALAQGLLYRETLFANAVWDGGPMDYKYAASDRTVYEAFGNFNYGAVGRAAGFSADVLNRMAGWAAARFSGGDPSILRALTENPAPFADTGDDPANIRAGMQYYDNGCYR